MKIINLGLNIPSGRYKYRCDCFRKLVERYSPEKESPCIVEFIEEIDPKCEAIIFSPDERFDLIFSDLERIDQRLKKTTDSAEEEFLKRVQSILEKEKLLWRESFTEAEIAALKKAGCITFKPCIEKTSVEDMDALIEEILEIAGIVLFFTVNKKEIKTWSIRKGESVLTAAGKIHSDLARGFIRAEVISCKDIDKFHNKAEAKTKGLVKIVDRDYIVENGDIIEIKFSV